VWDPAEPGASPVELGRHERGAGAAAVLPDGRVVTGGGSSYDGRVLVWDPAEPGPGPGPVELGRHEGGVWAAAVLPDGRVVTGGGRGYDGGRVLVWDPAEPGAAPVELGRHERGAGAAAVLPDGRVVTGGYDDRVWLRDVQSSSPGTLLACSAYALATSLSPSGARLFIGHAVGGISCWEVRPATQNMPGARQRAGNAMHRQT
jgi:WD40 repeat protein